MTTNTNAALREKLIDLIAETLSGTYHCTRVWAAWGFGTMSQDDFEDVGESDTPAELADAILSLLAAAPAAQAAQPAYAELPQITADDRSFLHYNPNTDDVVKWVLDYARAAITADRAMRAQAAPPQEAQEPVGWDGAEEWEKLAWHLCAEENGEDACNELIWEGGPIPEPWGDRWLKYEGEARRMIALVRTHVPAPQPAPVAQGDAEQRQMDAKDAAIYRWMLSNIADAWNIIDTWRDDAEAGIYELHGALAARAQAKEGAIHE